MITPIDFGMHPRQFFGMFGFKKTYDGMLTDAAKYRDIVSRTDDPMITCALLQAAATLEYAVARLKRLEQIILGEETDYASC